MRGCSEGCEGKAEEKIGTFYQFPHAGLLPRPYIILKYGHAEQLPCLSPSPAAAPTPHREGDFVLCIERTKSLILTDFSTFRRGNEK